MKEVVIWRIVHNKGEMSLWHVKFKLRPRGGAAQPMAEMESLEAQVETKLKKYQSLVEGGERLTL